MAHDDLDVVGAEPLRCGEHVSDERAPADRMQHLGQSRAHARALACGEDDDGERVPSHAPPPGLEPRPNSSKGCRAAITPRRTAAPEGAARQVCHGRAAADD